MSLISNPKPGDDVSVRQAIARLGSSKLGPTSTPTFLGITTTSLTISGLTTNSLIYPVAGLLTSLGAATNGQLPIGSTDAAPVIAGLTGTANQVTVTNGAGSITLSTPQNIHTSASNFTVAGATVTGASVVALNSAVFQPAAGGDSTTFFQVLDADGGTPVVNIDTTNERVGIKTNIPLCSLHIKANAPGTVGSHPAGQLIIQDPDDTVFGNAVITGYESDGAGNPDQQLWYLGSSSSSNSDIIYLNRRNSKLHLGTNGIVRMTIESGAGSGYIGIGELSPETLTEWTSTIPYLTLHNSTAEDADGGGEVRIIGKRHQSGDEETTHGQIEMSHDGVADDQLGKMMFGVNTGAAVVDRVKLDSTGLTIYSADTSDSIQIYHDNANAYLTWSDGTFIVQTDEGTNTNSFFDVRGKGTGYGVLYVRDQNNAEFFQGTCISGQAEFAVAGTAPVSFNIQSPADVPVTLFRYAASGETQELKIYGYRAGDAARILEIGVGVDAADSASFDGVTNYLFDGSVKVTGAFPVVRATRSSTDTNTVLGTIDCVHKTSGDMVDGFGSEMVFSIQDGASALEAIASIGGKRDGADTDGALVFNTWASDTKAERLTILPDGETGVGFITPTTRLEVAGMTSGVGTHEVMKWSYLTGEAAYNLKLQQIVTGGLVKHSLTVRNNSTDYANVLTFDKNLVGINTPSPDTSFQVVGDCKFGEDTTNYTEVEADGDIVQHGTGRFIESEKFKLTAIGGFAIKLANKTGATTVAGQLVKADTATDDAVILTAAGDVECIGVFLDSGIGTDGVAWVVVSGIADVAMEDNTAATHGNWVETSDAEAGYANATAATPAAAPAHFEEIGHCIESVAAGGGGTHILARCVLHFN